MLRIGEAAKRFDISNRTLRYWEEAGILKSSRAENGYRYYDDENTARINQIVLLRKLKMPLSDIERVFITADFGVAADALSSHYKSLKQDAAVYSSLIDIVEKLIRHMNKAQNLEQMFLCIEELNAVTDSRHETAPQIQLSERTIFMSTERLNNVRIVKLPAMTVAAHRAESTSPENDCINALNPFILEHNLHRRDGYRFFGFNNPAPTEGNLLYGYEMWITIPEDLDIPIPFQKKKFEGRLYASISTNMNEIEERWKQLHEWCKESDKFDVDSSSRCIEEIVLDLGDVASGKVEMQLDLLEPIKIK